MKQISVKIKLLFVLLLLFFFVIATGAYLFINTFQSKSQNFLFSKLQGLNSMYMFTIDELISYGLSLSELKDMDQALTDFVNDNIELNTTTRFLNSLDK